MGEFVGVNYLQNWEVAGRRYGTMPARPRFVASTSDLYVFDYDIKECPRPSDAEVEQINALIRRGQG